MDDIDPIEIAIEQAQSWTWQADLLLRAYCGVSEVENHTYMKGAAKQEPVAIILGETVDRLMIELNATRDNKITEVTIAINADSRTRGLIEAEIIPVLKAIRLIRETIAHEKAQANHNRIYG